MECYFRQLLAVIATILLWPLGAGAQSFQYIFNSSMPADNLTYACASALLSNISCDPWIAHFRPGQYYDPNGLMAVCTSSCETAIQNYQSALDQQCSGLTYNYTDTLYYPISAIGSFLLYNFDLVCLQDSGRFCNYIAYEASLQTNPGAQAVLGQPSSNDTISPCDNCFIKQLQLEAGSPFGGGDALASDYSSLTQSCSITGMPISTTSLASTAVSTTSSTTPTPTCGGKTYQVQSGDTCRSIAQSQGISVGWLVIDNPSQLNAYCANFTANATLCIQDTCQTYIVQQNDNCTSIANAYNVTMSQLISWNPILNPTCSNLNSSVNDTICIGKPGSPYPTPTSTLPVVTSFSTAAPVPTDVAANTTLNCGLYYEVQSGDYCNLVCLKFGITLDDFIFLNPAINENCTNLYANESYCMAPVGNIDDYPGHSGYISSTSFATTPYSSFPTATFTMPPLNISTPLPTANGTRTDCYQFADGSNMQLNVTGTSFNSVCQLYAQSFGVTLDMLQNWNPSLDTNSSNCAFDPSLQYCMIAYNASQVAPTTDEPESTFPLRDGTWTNCTDYIDATGNVDCAIILEWYNITITQFYEWNPSIGADCSNLWLEYSYCTSITNYTGSSDNGTTPSTTVTPPGPTQSGEPANCIQWYVAVSGDTCATVENTYHITDAQFHAWNPAVSADCTQGFWVGEAYCVGTSDSNTSSTTPTAPTSTSSAPAAPSPTQANSIISNCNKYAQAQSGDYCSIFAQNNGITTDNLYAWNAVLGSDGANCNSDFWAGYYYCVGVSS